MRGLATWQDIAEFRSGGSRNSTCGALPFGYHMGSGRAGFRSCLTSSTSGYFMV